MITINPAHLTDREERQARYLAAVAELRESEAAFLSAMQEHGKAEAIPQALYRAVADLEPDWRERAVPLVAAAKMHGITHITLKKSVADEDSYIRAELRPSAAGGRMEWWVDPLDPELPLIAERISESKRGRPRKTK